MKAPLVACLALGSALASAPAAQGTNPQTFADLRPTEGPIHHVQAVVDMDTREVSWSSAPIPAALGVTPNLFDNTLQPAAGVVAALLEPDTAIVDWGTLEIGQNTLVEQITVSYGADTPSPELTIVLFAGYEGFGSGPFQGPVVAGGPGLSQTVLEIELTGLPGDDVTPGNGFVVPYELQITLDSPFSLDALLGDSTTGFAPSARPVCFGWGYASSSGGVGPLLVDTQCLPSPFGPTSDGYEATTTTEPFLPPSMDASILPIGAPDDVVGLLLPQGPFSVEGESTGSLLVQGNGAVGIGANQDLVVCDGEFLTCSFEGTSGLDACYVYGAYWSQFADDFVGGDPPLVAGLESRVLADYYDDRVVVTWQNMTLAGLAGGNPGGTLLDFQAHFHYCTNQVEFRYAQPIDPFGAGGTATGGFPSFVGFLSSSQSLFGTGLAGDPDLQFVCDGGVGPDGYVITRGELPVNNGVTNKLDFYERISIAEIGTGAVAEHYYELVGTGDFDVAGLGPIASTFLRLELIEPCEIAIYYSLGIEDSVGVQDLFVSGPPIFGSLQEAIVVDYSGSYVYAVLATSPAVMPMPTPFGELWVDLVMPGFLEMMPLGDGVVPAGSGGVTSAVFPVVIPPYDPVLCGQVYHLQGGVFGGGVPSLTNAYAVVVGIDGGFEEN